MPKSVQLPLIELSGLISHQGMHELHFCDERGWMRRLLLTEEVKLALAGLMSLAAPEVDHINATPVNR